MSRPLLSVLRFRLRFKVGAVASLLGLAFGGALASGHRTVFLPGPTSDGHHLIEQECGRCHEPFGGVPNARCAGCHEAERAEDTHPPATFDDPRWAGTLSALDPRTCAACHHEHERARGGFTGHAEMCFPCHDDVVTKRPSHASFLPGSCARGGCHNYHDNSALNVAVLARHVGEPDLLARAGTLDRSAPDRRPAAPETAPPGLPARPELVGLWRASAHADTGVGCLDCHAPGAAAEASCSRCHGFEDKTFRTGKHGVRRAVGLPDLSPADARLPMKPDAPARLGCGTCHEPHSVDTRAAAVEACRACHDDRHTRAFAASPHARTLMHSRGEERPAAASVTCATCHLPRVEHESEGGWRVAVNHGNTLTLRPRDRMLKMVCQDCHGLRFALSALYDDALVERNFAGRPTRVHETALLAEGLTIGKSASEGGRSKTEEP
jgi:hypothetical protein